MVILFTNIHFNNRQAQPFKEQPIQKNLIPKAARGLFSGDSPDH